MPCGVLRLCIGPLCAVLAWSVVVRLDWYRQVHERTIAAQLGWNARLAEVSTPRPNLLLYRDLELFDPNNGQLLARLPFAEIDTSGDAVTVRLPFPAIINGTRFDAFWKVAQELGRASARDQHVQFAANNLTVHLDGGDQTYTELFGALDGDEGQALAKLSFRRAIAPVPADPEPCEIVLTRRQHAGTLIHSIEFSTGSTPLPAALIVSIWPGVAQLGKSCTFNGRASAIEQAGTWRTELRGDLADIDLDSLVRPFPHKLTGLAAARLDRVTISGGRLESAAGNFTAGPGVISRSLVQSAETHLHVCASDEAILGPSNWLPYEQLCAGFEMGPGGMTLRGAVPGTKGGLLVDKHFVLVEEAPVLSQPVVDLVRTLVPNSDVHVPATRETAVLATWLPMPAIMPPPGHEEPLPRGRLLDATPKPPERLKNLRR